VPNRFLAWRFWLSLPAASRACAHLGKRQTKGWAPVQSANHLSQFIDNIHNLMPYICLPPAVCRNGNLVEAKCSAHQVHDVAGSYSSFDARYLAGRGWLASSRPGRMMLALLRKERSPMVWTDPARAAGADMASDPDTYRATQTTNDVFALVPTHT